MSTVVLLGAGASHGTKYRLPVMKGFFEGIDTEKYKALVGFVEARCCHGKSPQNDWSLEEGRES